MECQTNFKSHTEWTRNLSDLYYNHSHADVTLICEGEKIFAHRSVLASLSPLFSQLLLDCESLMEPTIFLEGFSHKIIVCLVNFLYNGNAEGSSDELVTVSKYAKELKILGLVNSCHSREPFQLELLEKRKVEEQLQQLQSHEYDSDSNSSEDEDLQIIFENVQEYPVKTNEATKNTSSSEINSKRKRHSSQQCTVSAFTEKKIILDQSGIAESSNSKSANSVKPNKCSICKEIFKTRADLRSHLGTQHAERLTCNMCTKLFFSPITLKRHLKRHISSFDGLLFSLSAPQFPLNSNGTSDNITSN